VITISIKMQLIAGIAKQVTDLLKKLGMGMLLLIYIMQKQHQTAKQEY
jgi:hypothetical protein